MSFDVWIFHAINGLATRNPWVDAGAAVTAQYAPAVLAVGLVAQWVRSGPARRQRRQRVLLAVMAVMGALAVALVIGAVHFRPRPFAADPDVNLLVGRSSEPSFPSDHATVSAAVACLLALENRSWAVASWAIVAIVALARVFVGTHYPTDVLAGIALGYAAGWTVYRVRGPLIPALDHLLNWLESLPLFR